jgi:hypothetical protein
MTIQLQKRTTTSRPRDRSVEAYKAWITEISQRLTTVQQAIQLTESEWRANWKEYWEENQRSRSNQPHSGSARAQKKVTNHRSDEALPRP